MADVPDEAEDSFLTRQQNEVALLMSMYEDDFTLLSANDQPVECIIRLWSGNKNSSANPSALSRLDLHIKCPEEYPLKAPNVQIENLCKIAYRDVASLRQELLDLIDSLKGEVLIYELAQHCEKFVQSYSTHETVSFYESMMKRNRDLETTRARELQEIKEEQERKRLELISDIQTKERTVRRALRRKSKSEDDDEMTLRMERCDLSHISLVGPARELATPDLPKETKYKPWNPFQSSEGSSRLENDFEIIVGLGEGAYGEVFKVRNKLDGGSYAIKKIELNLSTTKSAHREITREIKLLSRLNHENVVRYYNSWVERSQTEDKSTSADSDVGEWVESSQDEDDNDDDEDEDDSYIVFRNDSKEPPNSSKEDTPDAPSVTKRAPLHSPKRAKLYMYIQMELCENSTLRKAIDAKLYEDKERVWRLFRQIVEGLCHIHDQKIMHRDLKPSNIFLDYNDQVKIGDFGLAKTSRTHKFEPSIDLDVVDVTGSLEIPSDLSGKEVLSHTGEVGTTLYKAPELNINNKTSKNRVAYNEKVDVYSLGIIFFEMNIPAFTTGTERFLTLLRIRKPEIVFPDELPFSVKSNEYKLIRWMLNHNVDERPYARDILATDCLTSLKQDGGDVMEIIQRTLSNPQSKDYKYLIASCFNQAMPPAFEATYDMSTFRQIRQVTSLSVASEQLRTIFHSFSAVSFAPPLLTPGTAPKNGVTLITNVGGIVHISPDLQTPFARYVIQNPSVMHFRRYVIDKVYREMPVGIHPKEIMECSYDIVSTSFGDLMPDLELFVVVRDILKAFPQISRRNPVVYLNHSVLINMILDVCFANSSTMMEKSTFRQELIRLISENSTTTTLRQNLRQLNMSEACINMIRGWIDLKESPVDILSEFSCLIFDHEHQIPACEAAIKQLNHLTKEMESLNIGCPVVIKLSLIANPNHYTGVLFQVVCDNNKPRGKSTTSETQLMFGGRYDGLLSELEMKIPSKEPNKPVRCVTGFVLYLESLVNLMTSLNVGVTPVADAVFCVLGSSSSVLSREHVMLIEKLWTSNIKVFFIDSVKTMDEIQNVSTQTGASVLLIVKENDPNFVRVRTLGKDGKTVEKKLNLNEVTEYLIKSFKQQETLPVVKPIQSSTMTYISIFGNEKMGNVKIYQNQIEDRLASVIQKISPTVRIEVLAFPAKGELINYLCSTIELNDPMACVDSVCKKFPIMKKMIQRALKHICDVKSSVPQSVIILYSLIDNLYKAIL